LKCHEGTNNKKIQTAVESGLDFHYVADVVYRFNRLSLTFGCMTLCTFFVHGFTLAVAFASMSLAEEQIIKV
jgi:hypothetical protein